VRKSVRGGENNFESGAFNHSATLPRLGVVREPCGFEDLAKATATDEPHSAYQWVDSTGISLPTASASSPLSDRKTRHITPPRAPNRAPSENAGQFCIGKTETGSGKRGQGAISDLESSRFEPLLIASSRSRSVDHFHQPTTPASTSGGNPLPEGRRP
jgi:hypothetical protein